MANFAVIQLSIDPAGAQRGAQATNQALESTLQTANRVQTGFERAFTQMQAHIQRASGGVGRVGRDIQRSLQQTGQVMQNFGTGVRTGITNLVSSLAQLDANSGSAAGRIQQAFSRVDAAMASVGQGAAKGVAAATVAFSTLERNATATSRRIAQSIQQAQAVRQAGGVAGGAAAGAPGLDTTALQRVMQGVAEASRHSASKISESFSRAFEGISKGAGALKVSTSALFTGLSAAMGTKIADMSRQFRNAMSLKAFTGGGAAGGLASLNAPGQKLLGIFEKMKDVGGSLRGMFSGLGAAAGIAATGVGLLVVGLVALAGAAVGVAKKLIDTAVAAGKMADGLTDAAAAAGISAGQMLALEDAAIAVGASPDKMVAAFDKFQQKMDDIRSGSAPQLEKQLKALGITAQQAAQNPYDAFLRFGKAVNDLRDPLQRASIGQEFLGRGATRTATAIAEAAKQTAEQTAQMTKMVGVAAILGDQLDRWDQFMRKAAIAIGAQLSPALTVLLGDIQKVMVYLGPAILYVTKLLANMIAVAIAAARTIKKTLGAGLLDIAIGSAAQNPTLVLEGLRKFTELNFATLAGEMEGVNREMQALINSVSGAPPAGGGVLPVIVKQAKAAKKAADDTSKVIEANARAYQDYIDAVEKAMEADAKRAAMSREREARFSEQAGAAAEFRQAVELARIQTEQLAAEEKIAAVTLDRLRTARLLADTGEEWYKAAAKVIEAETRLKDLTGERLRLEYDILEARRKLIAATPLAVPEPIPEREAGARLPGFEEFNRILKEGGALGHDIGTKVFEQMEKAAAKAKEHAERLKQIWVDPLKQDISSAIEIGFEEGGRAGAAALFENLSRTLKRWASEQLTNILFGGLNRVMGDLFKTGGFAGPGTPTGAVITGQPQGGAQSQPFGGIFGDLIKLIQGGVSKMADVFFPRQNQTSAVQANILKGIDGTTLQMAGTTLQMLGIMQAASAPQTTGQILLGGAMAFAGTFLNLMGGQLLKGSTGGPNVSYPTGGEGINYGFEDFTQPFSAAPSVAPINYGTMDFGAGLAAAPVNYNTVQMTVNATDAASFVRTQDQIMGQMQRGLDKANRNS